jgi:hypothetical protein
LFVVFYHTFPRIHGQAPQVNYRRLKAGGIPLHRIPIEKT